MGLFSDSVGRNREGGKQNQKAKIEDIFRLLQPSTGHLLLFIFFICDRDANQESEQFLSERAVQGVKE